MAFSTSPLFKDRAEAGKQLAARLVNFKQRDPLILALPRGGVAIGYEIAVSLDALLDVLVARKLGAPFNPEFGIGAIAEGGVVLLNDREVELLGITKQELQELIDQETAEMERRVALFRGNRHNPQVKGRTIILVDDGLATGVTARAAIQSLRLAEPGYLIFAVPVCAQDTVKTMRDLVDELVCLYQPTDFFAVGQWYEQFPQLTDQEVVGLLEKAHHDIKK